MYKTSRDQWSWIVWKRTGKFPYMEIGWCGKIDWLMTCCYVLTRQIYVCIHRIPKEGDENKDRSHQTSLNHDGLDIEGFFNSAVLFTFISLFFHYCYYGLLIIFTLFCMFQDPIILYSLFFVCLSFFMFYGVFFALLVNYSLFCKP